MNSKKLLIIDDNEFYAKLLGQKFAEIKYEVSSCNDGIQGLDSATKNRYDLIILDLIMPGKDGFEVLEKLRQATLTHKTPIVVFSTLSQDEDVEKVKKLGASGHVSKYGDSIENIIQKILALANNEQV